MLARLIEQTQHNCNISDAHFAQDATLCIYLLRMREFYRWENSIPFSSKLPKDDLSTWITQREVLWDSLIDKPFIEIEINGIPYSPFDASAINQVLAQHDHVYSAGYGRQLKPIFFVGRLEKHYTRDGFSIAVATDEYAREIEAPSAVIQEHNIFIRKDAIRRMVWQRFEEWQWRQKDTRFSRAMSYYDVKGDIDLALDKMTETEVETMVLHEIGEGMATNVLGDAWHDMLIELGYSKAAILARAVRDHIADTNSTLPGLMAQKNEAALAAYHANLNGMRAEIFPGLNEALTEWQSRGQLDGLEKMVISGRSFWTEIAEHILALHQRFRSKAGPRIEHFMKPLTL